MGWVAGASGMSGIAGVAGIAGIAGIAGVGVGVARSVMSRGTHASLARSRGALLLFTLEETTAQLEH